MSGIKKRCFPILQDLPAKQTFENTDHKFNYRIL